tara:strand:+ start:22 stop:522 length:501 start_codon:yes stop_codon:yes gene_type:complete
MIKDLEKMLKGVSENRTFLAVLTVLLTLYVVFAAPELPEVLRRLFDLPLFRFAILFLVAYFAKYRNPTIALVVGLAFLFVTNLLSEGRLLESYRNVANYEAFQQRAEGFDDEEESSGNKYDDCNCESWNCKAKRESEEEVDEEEEDDEEDEDEEFGNYQRRLATGA